jgi:cysteinyl-tRNA synthetase
MAMYRGETHDIHTGGIDLAFAPRNEIASLRPYR